MHVQRVMSPCPSSSLKSGLNFQRHVVFATLLSDTDPFFTVKSEERPNHRNY